MSLKLSEHFTLEELCVTQVRDADNEPRSEAVLTNLRGLAQRMEGVRALLGSPIIITSGFRSSFVNKIVGGSITSAHMTGNACDFICPGFGSPFEVCKKIEETSSILFDQLIFEETWVHLSFAPRMRREVLTKRRHGTFVAGLRSDSGASGATKET